MASTVTVSYLGVQGEGRSKADAKKDACTKIEDALKGGYTPKIVAWRGTIALVWRESSGWNYRIISDPDREVVTGSVYGSTTDTTEEGVLIQAYMHLADLGWQQGDELDPPSWLDPEQIKELVSREEWRERYKIARASGMDDYEAHACASGFRRS